MLKLARSLELLFGFRTRPIASLNALTKIIILMHHFLSSSLAVVQVAGHFFRDQFGMKNGKNTNANIINIK